MDVAGTYFGAQGDRAISEKRRDVSHLSDVEIADALNDYVKRYGDGLESEYSFVPPEEATKVSKNAEAATLELIKLTKEKIAEYADKLAADFTDETYKTHKQLIELQEKLYLGDKQSMLTWLYLLINHTDANRRYAESKQCICQGQRSGWICS